MSACIGIRHEDKYPLEKRTPLIPADIRRLISDYGLEFCVQSSAKRIFSDKEYSEAGANVKDSLDDCSVIMGVKEIPEHFFEKNKTYIFFSHVVKGQLYNMPMLRKMIELKCTLIDYEKIEDDFGKRLIFFGRFAGLAGMINTLWALGQRYKETGILTAFEIISQSHTYNSLEEARKDISQAGMEITKNGLPENISPFIIAVTGYGNVSNGVQEILNLLPVKEICPEEIPKIANMKNLPRNIIFRATFKEEDISEHKEGKQFELEHYYKEPQMYNDKFSGYIPYLNCIVNGMYWDARYPKIVTKQYLKRYFSKGNPRLTVIGDITCDPGGSIECTHKGMPIDNPVFVYHPDKETYTMGFKGNGIVIMAVDILPSELPRESSVAFSFALRNFIPSVAKADFNAEFENLDLPTPIKKAVILHKGKLTPKYDYIRQYLV